MRVRLFSSTLLLMLMAGVIPVHAQYKEMSRLDNLSRKMPEPDVFSGMAMHFGVSVDTLKEEKSTHDISFGQLYLAHAIAKASKSDVKSILLDSKSKVWPEIAREKNIDLKELSNDENELENKIRKLQNGK